MAVNNAQPLFYKNVVALSRERHGEWFIQPEENFHYTREANCVYVAGIEFPHIAKEYPIVFGTGPQDTVVPVALLGIKNQQNMFINDAGEWQASYIPAYIRRYPFILAPDANGENFTVCIDESYSGFNTVNEGQRLIREDGEHGELLARSVAFLKDYQSHIKLTEQFCARIKALDLLEPMQANVEMKSGEKFALTGFLCINKNKIKELDAEIIKDLVMQNYVDLIYSHFNSISNISSLINRMN